MTPDDRVWLADVKRLAQGLKVAIESNRRVSAGARADAVRNVDAAVTHAAYEIVEQPRRVVVEESVGAVACR